jgi:hypothetical protein
MAGLGLLVHPSHGRELILVGPTDQTAVVGALNLYVFMDRSDQPDDSENLMPTLCYVGVMVRNPHVSHTRFRQFSHVQTN